MVTVVWGNVGIAAGMRNHVGTTLASGSHPYLLIIFVTCMSVGLNT